MPEPRTDRAERRIAAPPAAVFGCWTDPARLVRWLAPEGMTARTMGFEPRPGGIFRLALAYADPSRAGKSGGGQDVVEGRFLSLDPPRHLAFSSQFVSDDPAMAGEMRMDWHFDPDRNGDATLVRIAATGVPPGIAPDDHAAGMASTLANLAALVERS